MCPRSVPVMCLYGLDNGAHGQRKLSRASFGDERFTDPDFSDDAVLFAETMEVLVGLASHVVLSKESLGLQIS